MTNIELIIDALERDEPSPAAIYAMRLYDEAPAMRDALRMFVHINEEWAEKQYLLDSAIDVARSILARIDT